MEGTFLRVATLTEDQVAAIRSLEEATGKHIMAFEPGLTVAELNDEQVAQIKGLEERLNVTLLVFD